MNYEDIESHTHSPKGEYATTEENYQRLLSRLKTAPPITPSQRIWSRKWSVAASVAILCGLAWATTWHFSRSFTSDSATNTEKVIQQTNMLFTDTPLSEVLAAIANRYNINTATIDTKDDIRITAEFAADEPLEEVLEALSMVSGFDIRVDGGEIVVK
ncbi:MAG: DUF4974 domain-containing protein [Bacteroidia bacterium]|nr:DUF4974 domain-containing protein [Bacteroidia bacterium]